MKKIFWRIIGHGNHNLVLLHGWGSNSNIWLPLIEKLSLHFRIYLVDLPGYGNNKNYEFVSLEEISNAIVFSAPDGAIWLGWSFGGLIAMEIASKNKKNVKALITVSSSPYFCQDKEWPGINSTFFLNFSEQLKKNFLKTVNRFFNLQTLKTKHFRKNIEQLKNSFFPIPNLKSLIRGLSILRTCDLRNTLSKILVPFLHLYGDLDSLIPCEISTKISNLCPKSKNFIFLRAAHVPFLSHTNKFCEVIQKFTQEV